ncbi:hypothetical protein CPB85DRAFT_1514290 [Mucidula mucida]|nr:hypothetical protein CPB85DRAFT_1514290 [Mucidula mucida]
MSTKSKSNKRQKTVDSPSSSDPEEPSSDDIPLEPHSDGSSSPLRAPNVPTLYTRSGLEARRSQRHFEEIQGHLKLASPHGDRDTSTLRGNFTAGHQNAHVLRRATPSDLGPLNLDIHMNQMTLTPSNHIDYSRIWAGAPFGELLTDKLARFFKDLSIEQSIIELSTQYIPETDGLGLWRPVEDANEESGYRYDLETLMEPLEGHTFQSHVHPFFMLFNAAEKIHYWRQECTGIPATLTDAQKAICDTIENLTSDWFEDESDDGEDEDAMSVVLTESVTTNTTGDRRSVRIINANAKKRNEPDGGHDEE